MGDSSQSLADPSLTFENVTLRQRVHLTVRGRAVRLRLDNTFRDSAVTRADVQVGAAAVRARQVHHPGRSTVRQAVSPIRRTP